MSVTGSDKTTFAVAGFEPWTLSIRRSDNPARPKAAPNLKIKVSSGYIYNKTWKGPRVPVGGHSGRFRPRQITFTVQDTEYYVISFELSIFIMLDVSVSVCHCLWCTNSRWHSRFNMILQLWLRFMSASLNQTYSAVESKLWMWNFQQKIMLIRQSILQWKFLRFHSLDPDSNSVTLNRAAGCFQPLRVLYGAELVQNHETELEICLWFLR